MPRRRSGLSKKKVEADPVYKSKLVTRFINKIMLDGKKSLAERLVYDALEIIQSKTDEDPLMIFENAIDNVRPRLEVRPRRVGGATFQVPMEVDRRRSLALSIRWLKESARARNEKRMEEKIANEILDASNYRGAAYTKRENVHKMAEANRAFAHYRW